MLQKKALEGPCGDDLEDTNSGTHSYIRFLPDKLEDLEDSLIRYYQGLRSTTIICICLLGGNLSNLVGEILPSPKSCPAWMLFSRLFLSKRQPVTMLLPVYLVEEDNLSDDANCGVEPISKSDLLKKWVCPSGRTLVDDIAPQFKLIREENYLSTSISTADNVTQKNRFIWWQHRAKLNHRLDKVLRNMEDSWLGPWRCLLLGNHINCKNLDNVVMKVKSDLKCRCQLEVNESLLKAVLGGACCRAESELCVSQLLAYKGHLGRGGCCGKDIFQSFSSSLADGSVNGLPQKMMLEGIDSIVEEVIDREPVILVLDANLQACVELLP